jgi:hypothetical protein
LIQEQRQVFYATLHTDAPSACCISAVWCYRLADQHHQEAVTRFDRVARTLPHFTIPSLASLASLRGLPDSHLALQIWTNDKQWQGFIICCEKAAPASYPVLLQLPPNILEAALEKVAERHWRELLKYATSKECTVPVFQPVRDVLNLFLDRLSNRQKARVAAAAAAAGGGAAGDKEKAAAAGGGAGSSAAAAAKASAGSGKAAAAGAKGKAAEVAKQQSKAPAAAKAPAAQQQQQQQGAKGSKVATAAATAAVPEQQQEQQQNQDDGDGGGGDDEFMLDFDDE